MSEATTYTYQLDHLAKLEITPAGKQRVFGNVLAGEVQLYDYRLSVMGMTVFAGEGAPVQEGLNPGEAAVLMLESFCAPVPERTGLSATQRKWYESGAAAHYLATVLWENFDPSKHKEDEVSAEGPNGERSVAVMDLANYEVR